jgi:mono/diheme cytochrome c family protein
MGVAAPRPARPDVDRARSDAGRARLDVGRARSDVGRARSDVGRVFRPGACRALTCVTLAGAWTLALVLHAQTDPPRITVKDKVYTSEQADRGEKSYKQICAKCHLFDGPKTKDGPPLGGDVFFAKWEGKTVFEMAVGIRLNMPPDGSVFLEDDETADLVAFILKSNGFPPGEQPLRTDASSKNLIFVRNK